MERLLALGTISALMYLFIRAVPPSLCAGEASPTLSFGFLIIAAYLAADLLSRLRLPKITGYILAGMVFGPSLLGLLSFEVVSELRLVDDLALTFIAFAAGGELRLSMLREGKRSLLCNLAAIVLLTFCGVTGALFALRSHFPFCADLSAMEALAISAIAGSIAVARSPSSAIAVISETRSRGPFTEMVLGVTVAMDVLVIFIFAITVSFAEVILTPGRSLNLTFLAAILGAVVASLAAGLLLGKVVAFYLERIRAQLTFFTLAAAFLVTRLSGALSQMLEVRYGVSFHLEPMLICITAGFVVQNFSRSGEGFLQVIDRSSIPIYVTFFALSGAALRLQVLQTTWHWALVLLALRGMCIYLAGLLGGLLGRDPPRSRRVGGLAFLTQAGVSLGLVKVVLNKFPTFGAAYATLLVAVITLNQIVGPVGLKAALTHVGETLEARRARRGLGSVQE